MKASLILSSILSVCLISSCQKKDVDGYQQDKLNISISKPLPAQVFKKGDTIFMSGKADYVSQLHGYEISIVNDATGEKYFEQDEHVHDATFNIESYWVDTLSQSAALTFKLTVEVDHDGNSESKEVHCASQP